ncbi:MAG: lectin like domain-containing protein [Bacillota bacterium]|nr:lectin like domain-containing protein [Bacillota bacterium]
MKKSVLKKICAVTTTITISCCVLRNSNVNAAGNVYFNEVKPNFNYLTDLNNIKLNGTSNINQKGLGKKGSSIKITKNLSLPNLKKDANLPAQYDSRSYGFITSVKDQGSVGSCWAFAATAALESYLLKSGQGSYDLSENNLVTENGFDDLSFEYNGGIRDMATAYYASWNGPALEKDDPYPENASPFDIVVRGKMKPVKHVQDVLYLPDRTNSTDNSEIKQAVMQYGSVDSSIHYDDKYYNAANHSFYNTVPLDTNDPNNTAANHDITIVGWDDNYSASNFSPAAPGNGAFICKNNWGTSWGDNGYFYVSYYDTIIGTDTTVFTAEAANNYDNIYQYDPLGYVTYLTGNSSSTWYSNVFTAGSASNEDLAAVSFYTLEQGQGYQIYIKHNAASGDFSNLIPLKSGTIAEAGYHTIKLDKKVLLKQGEKYAIVVKTTAASGDAKIPVEDLEYSYSSNAASSAGESYVSIDGLSWTDITTEYSDANVCLKAFTDKSRDLNKDGKVDILDLAQEAQAYNTKTSSSSYNDLNSDSIIDVYDLVKIASDM